MSWVVSVESGPRRSCCSWRHCRLWAFKGWSNICILFSYTVANGWCFIHLNYLLRFGFWVNSWLLLLDFDCHVLVDNSYTTLVSGRYSLSFELLLVGMINGIFSLIHIELLIAFLLKNFIYCSHSLFVTWKMSRLVLGLELCNASWSQTNCLLAVQMRHLLFLQWSRIDLICDINSRHCIRRKLTRPHNFLDQLVLLGLFELKKLLAHFLALDECVCHYLLLAPLQRLIWTNRRLSSQAERLRNHDLLRYLRTSWANTSRSQI